MFSKGYKPKLSPTIYRISDVKYNGVWYYEVSVSTPKRVAIILNQPIIDYGKEIFYYENELI